MSLRRRGGLVAILGAMLALALWHPRPAAGLSLSCASQGIRATMNTFATVGLGPEYWLENMGFDGQGGMWVSELELGKLVRFDAQGVPGASLPLASPGASMLAPDGRMVALYGDSDLGTLPGAAPAGVVTFDPAATTPVATPFASGFSMANGGALDSAGNLYVADTLTPGILKYSPSGVLDTAFEQATQIAGADGVAVDGDTLYVTQLTSVGAAIVQVPLADPKAYTVLASLSPLLGPDDLAIGPDGALYVAMASGQLVRVDRATGTSCVVLETGVPITSVRFPIDFAPYSADAGDAFVSSEAGEIFHVHISGLTLRSPTPSPPAPSTYVTVSPRRIRAGRPHTVRITVRAPYPVQCDVDVPLRIGRRRLHSNARGRATVRVRFAHPGRISIVARKPGCAPGTATLRVVARSGR